MSPVSAQFGHAEGTLVYPGEYGAVGETEIRQLFEPSVLTRRLADTASVRPVPHSSSTFHIQALPNRMR